MMYLWLNEHGVGPGPEFYMLSWCKKSVQFQDFNRGTVVLELFNACQRHTHYLTVIAMCEG